MGIGYGSVGLNPGLTSIALPRIACQPSGGVTPTCVLLTTQDEVSKSGLAFRDCWSVSSINWNGSAFTKSQQAIVLTTPSIIQGDIALQGSTAVAIRFNEADMGLYYDSYNATDLSVMPTVGPLPDYSGTQLPGLASHPEYLGIEAFLSFWWRSSVPTRAEHREHEAHRTSHGFLSADAERIDYNQF